MLHYELFKRDLWDYTINKIFDNIIYEEDCWVWMGTMYADDYTKINLKYISISAKRASYMAFIGEIPYKKAVYNSCNNNLCINPNHLFLATSGTTNEQLSKNSNR